MCQLIVTCFQGPPSCHQGGALSHQTGKKGSHNQTWFWVLPVTFLTNMVCIYATVLASIHAMCGSALLPAASGFCNFTPLPAEWVLVGTSPYVVACSGLAQSAASCQPYPCLGCVAVPCTR
jgi:hypothetical protein